MPDDQNVRVPIDLLIELDSLDADLRRAKLPTVERRGKQQLHVAEAVRRYIQDERKRLEQLKQAQQTDPDQ